jgi:hypothetical protein
MQNLQQLRLEIRIATGRFRNHCPELGHAIPTRSVNVHCFERRGLILNQFMADRIRRCVECPNCLIRYLLASSPYDNGSYLIPTVTGSWDECALYCSCGKSRSPSLYRWNEIKNYIVSKPANERGYGVPDEIIRVSDRSPSGWPFDISRYVNMKPAEKNRNSG